MSRDNTYWQTYDAIYAEAIEDLTPPYLARKCAEKAAEQAVEDRARANGLPREPSKE